MITNNYNDANEQVVEVRRQFSDYRVEKERLIKELTSQGDSYNLKSENLELEYLKLKDQFESDKQEYGNKINDLTQKIKLLSREISEKSTEIDKINENVRLKEMEKMEISRKQDSELMNMTKESKSYVSKIKEQDDFIKELKEQYENVQIEFRKLKYEHTNLLKLSEHNKSTLQKEKDDYEAKYQSTLSK